MSQQSMLCTGGGGGPNSMKNMEGEEDGTDSDCKLCLHYSFADCLVVSSLIIYS